MLDFVNALDAAFEMLSKHVYPHAPFYGVTLVLLIIGDRMSSRIFTKERAYRYYGPTTAGRWKWRVYFWGRETLPMQPILMGALIGLSWLDPEGKGWNRVASVAYFATAGAASMFAWACTKAWAKKKGIILSMPGESGPPAGHPSMPYEVEIIPERKTWDEQHVRAQSLPPVDDLETRKTTPPPRSKADPRGLFEQGHRGVEEILDPTAFKAPRVPTGAGPITRIEKKPRRDP